MDWNSFYSILTSLTKFSSRLEDTSANVFIIFVSENTFVVVKYFGILYIGTLKYNNYLPKCWAILSVENRPYSLIHLNEKENFNNVN